LARSPRVCGDTFVSGALAGETSASDGETVRDGTR
jgi:hypothetical protein